MKRQLQVLFFGTLITIGATAVALLLCVFYAQYEMRTLETQLFSASAATTFAPEVRQDLDSLAKQPVFAMLDRPASQARPERDAGLFFNERLPWSNGKAANPALNLPQGLPERLESWRDDWLQHVPDTTNDLKALDFGWLDQLSVYDYWDLENVGPIADALQQNPQLDPLTEPFPDFKIIQNWAKLKLLATIADPTVDRTSPPAGLNAVTKLAQLTMTTETLVSELVALSILRNVASAAAYLQAQDRLSPSWEGPTAAELDKAKQALWALAGYIDFTIPADVTAQVIDTTNPPLGICGALHERLPRLTIERLVLKPFYPEQFAAFDKQLAAILSQRCRLRSIRHYWQSEDLLPELLKGNLLDRNKWTVSDAKTPTPPFALSWETVQKYDLLRRSFGLIVVAAGGPDFFLAYKQSPSTP